MTAETIWVRTESGVILQMDLPLTEGIGQRLARGEIVRVANAEGDPWEPPAELPTPSAEEAAGELAALREDLSKALIRNEELQAERDAAVVKLEAVKVERDAAVAELDKVMQAAQAAGTRPAKATKAAPAAGKN